MQRLVLGLGVLVLVAVTLPVMLMLTSFVVDVSNWWEHKRHLQIEADAAVLAGGGVYAFPCTASVDSAIYSEALKYAGPSATNPAAPYNSRALLDACRPFERLDSFPHVAEASPSLVRETLARWRELFVDPRFPLPASAIPSGAVDAPPTRQSPGKTVVTEMTS